MPARVQVPARVLVPSRPSRHTGRAATRTPRRRCRRQGRPGRRDARADGPARPSGWRSPSSPDRRCGMPMRWPAARRARRRHRRTAAGGACGGRSPGSSVGRQPTGPVRTVAAQAAYDGGSGPLFENATALRAGVGRSLRSGTSRRSATCTSSLQDAWSCARGVATRVLRRFIGSPSGPSSDSRSLPILPLSLRLVSEALRPESCHDRMQPRRLH